MTTSAADPNGWVSNPPSTLVKIVNTTRENLNGQMAVVLAYDQSRSRYVIHLTISQQQVSLKVDNLIKASWMEQMRGQFELFQNNPDIQRQVMQITNRIQTATGGRVDSLQKVAMLLGIIVLTTIYVIGFSKTLLLLSFMMMMGIIIAPDLQASGNTSPRQIIQNLPMRIRTVIRQQMPYGNVIADNNLYTAALVGLVLAFFINALVQRRGAVPAAVASESTSWLSLPSWILAKVGLASRGNGGDASASVLENGPMNTVLDTAPPSIVKPYISKTKSLLENAYKLGFEDATNKQEFGTSSLDELLLQQQQEEAQRRAATTMSYHDEFHDLPPSPRIISPPPPRASSSSTLGSASSMFSILYIGRTLYSAGQTAEGGFDVQLMIANLRTMDQIRLAMLAFSIYRLVSLFLF